MMHGQTRIEFIFGIVIFMIIIFYIVNQMNAVFSDMINGYETDTRKAQALNVIKTLVETGDIEKKYLTEVPVDVVLVNDISGSMDGEGSGWGQNCLLDCYSFGASTCVVSSSCSAKNCTDHKCGDCDDNGYNADPGESPCSINNAKSAAKIFVNLLNTSTSKDEAGIVTFNLSAYHYLNMTFDKDTILASIDAIKTRDGTAIGYGIVTATDEILKHGRGALAKGVEILLTDGRDDPCCTDTDGAARTAAANNITIYTIGVGSSSYINETVLKNIASITGGEYYYVPDSQQLSSIYQEIAYEIRSEVIRFGLIANQPYNVTIEKIYNLGQNCDNLNIFNLGTYRLKIYNSTNLLLFCGTDTLRPPKVFASKYVWVGDDKGNITLELW